MLQSPAHFGRPALDAVAGRMSPRLSLVFSHPTERMLEMASKNGVSEVSHSEAGATPALQQQQNPAYGRSSTIR